MTYHRGKVFCLLLGVDFLPSQHTEELLLNLFCSIAHVYGDCRPPDVGLSFDSQLKVLAIVVLHNVLQLSTLG